MESTIDNIHSTLRSLDELLWLGPSEKQPRVHEPAPLSNEDLPISAHFTQIRCGEHMQPLSPAGFTSLKIEANTFQACVRIECDSLRPFHCFFPRVLNSEHVEVGDQAFTLGEYSEPLSKPSWREGWLHLRSPPSSARINVYVRVAVGGMGGLPEAFAELHFQVQVKFQDVMPEDLLQPKERDVLVGDLVSKEKRLTDMRLADVRDWVDVLFPDMETVKRSRITRACKQYIVTQVGTSPPPQPVEPTPEAEAELEELPEEQPPRPGTPPPEEPQEPLEPADPSPPAGQRKPVAVEEPHSWMKWNLWGDPDDPSAVDWTAMSPGTVWKKLSRSFVKPRKRIERKALPLRSPSIPVKANISLQDAPSEEPEGDGESTNLERQLSPTPDEIDGKSIVEIRKHSNSTPSSLAAPAANALVVQAATGVLIFQDASLTPYGEDRTVRFRSVRSCNDVLSARCCEMQEEPCIRVESASGAMPLAVLDTKAAVRHAHERAASNRHVVIHRVKGSLWETVGPGLAWVYHVSPRILEVHYMELGGELFLRVHRSPDLQFIAKMEDATGSEVFRREPARSFKADGTPLAARVDLDDSDGFAFWVAPGVDLVLIACTLLAVQKLA